METPVVTRQATFHALTLSVHTGAAREFVDLTEDLIQALTSSGIRDGLAVVSSQHTTAAIVINEHEPELLKDLDGFLLGLASDQGVYNHNAVPCGPEEVPNGHAHCQALLLSASASIPVAGGRPLLGRYQRVFLVELDHPRPRRVNIVLMGS